MRKSTLTRILALLLVLSMLFACSCGISNVDTSSNTVTNQEIVKDTVSETISTSKNEEQIST